MQLKAADVFDVIDRKPAVDSLSTEGVRRDEPLNGDIEFQDVTFSYPTACVPARPPPQKKERERKKEKKIKKKMAGWQKHKMEQKLKQKRKTNNSWSFCQSPRVEV